MRSKKNFDDILKEEAKKSDPIANQGIPLTPDSNKKDYSVVTKRGIKYTEIHNDLIRDTSADDSVDSNIIPDRVVEIIQERPNSNRVTRYNLTDAEAKKLSNDSRILSCKYHNVIKPTSDKYQSGNFDRDADESSENQNWGLLRHTSLTNNYGTSSSDPGGTYDYVLDGTGVDIVVIDSGIEANHPEWEDANGVTRLKQIDWFTAAGVSGTWPNNMYEDEDGHGTHVTSTVAGKYFGWAKNADIYSMRLLGGTLTNSSDWNGNGDSIYDILKLWHINKNNPNHTLWTGKFRPTVVNMSFGYSMWINIDADPNYSTTFGLSDVYAENYRGTSTTWRQKLSEMNAKYTSPYGYTSASQQYRGLGWSYDSDIAAWDDLADATTATGPGILVCKSAGNSGNYIDKPSGSDQENEIWILNTAKTSYYSFDCMKGQGADDRFCVGAIDSTSYDANTDRKTDFSRTGPGVNIWMCGENIIGACSNTNDMSYYNPGNYYYNNSYKQVKIGGTSMAAPQVCGMSAVVLQAHPDWTPKQVVSWLRDKATATINEGTGSDFTSSYGLWTSDNKMGYMPMHGRKPWNYGSS
jgi:subtilisin family serine protease|tara:strand:+ start:72 stop:1808 length:1737 start_codon:yes stop_codon:yes gene_type:complete